MPYWGANVDQENLLLAGQKSIRLRSQDLGLMPTVLEYLMSKRYGASQARKRKELRVTICCGQLAEVY